MTASPADQLPTVFVPHGGGPCFFMEWTTGAHISAYGFGESITALPR